MLTRATYGFALARSLISPAAAMLALLATSAQVHASATYTISGNTILKNGVKFEGRGVDAMQGSASDALGASWGMDILRIPIDMKAQTNAQIQTLVSNAQAQGMVAMIDAHWYDNQDMGGTLPWNVAQLTGTNPSSHPDWTQILTRWQQLANLFKNQSDVWFDVWNEPYYWDGSHGYSDNLWASDMGTLISNIRATGATNILCVPGSNQGQGWQVIVNRGPALISGLSNVMFTIHCYTSQNWNTNAATVQSQLQAITNAGLALNIGEYGAETTGENVPAVLTGAANAKIGAIAWAWNCDSSDILSSDCVTPNPVNNYGPEVQAYTMAARGLAAAPGNAQAALSWTASPVAASYNVYRGTASGGESGTAIATGISATTYTNTGLTNGTAYYYTVAAVNASGTSGASNEASATPAVVVTSGPVKINCAGPAASPFVADADFSGGTTATNWTGAINTSAVASPAPQAVYQSERYGASTYTIGGLTANANYTVRLHFCENYFTASAQRVFNVTINNTQVLTNFDIYATTGAAHKANCQQFTEAANGSGQIIIAFVNVTNNALIDGIEVNTLPPPAAPAGLTATPGNAQVALSWTASSGATSYNVLRSTVSGSGYAPVATGIGTTSYTNTGLANGTTYYFVVTATNSGGASGNSNQASATPSGDTAQYNFESGIQGWTSTGPVSGLTSSTAQYYAGSHSLTVAINATAAGTADVHINAPSTPAGAVVTFHVRVPSGSNLDWIQPYVYGTSPGYAWTGDYTPIANVTTNAWNTYTVTVPASGSAPLTALGVQFHASAAWTGTCYIDSIHW